MPSNTWLAWALTLVICIERSPSKPWRHHHFLPPWSHHVPPGLPQHGMCERIACHFERRARNQQMECGHTNHVKYAGIYVFEWFLHFQKIWVLSKNGGVGSYTCDGAMLHHALQNLRRQRLFPRVADPCLSTIRLWVKIGYPIRWHGMGLSWSHGQWYHSCQSLEFIHLLIKLHSNRNMICMPRKMLKANESYLDPSLWKKHRSIDLEGAKSTGSN